mgnify:CR=1
MFPGSVHILQGRKIDRCPAVETGLSGQAYRILRLQTIEADDKKGRNGEQPAERVILRFFREQY